VQLAGVVAKAALPMKWKAWSPAVAVLASIRCRSMRSAWAWLKSVMRSALAPTALSPIAA